VGIPAGYSASNKRADIPAGYSASNKRADMLDGKTAKLPKAVNFEDASGRMDSRKKYLTAKYGSHQMALIRKRLSVEMWLLEEMTKLYGTLPGGEEVPYKELDLDELLDLEETQQRRGFLHRFLDDASAASRQQIDTFIEELLALAIKL